MWIELTDVNGERIAVNLDHVVSYNAYGHGAKLMTTTPDLTYFVRENLDVLQKMLAIKPASGK